MAWPWVLGALGCVLLFSGIDDLAPSLICFWRLVLRKREGEYVPALEPPFQRRIAIFVPCWKESAVIGNMIRHNLAAVCYHDYDFFLGVYPNDTETLQVARQLAATFRNVHFALCPRPGPTSKADCLNSIYRRMQEYERESGLRFDTVVLHDAEDLIHPDALAIINRERVRYAMVQVPVLPLPTPFSEFTHGVYCDDFAEYQTVDMRARQFCRSFIPSNGVGTGFAREILDRLAAERNNLVFNPASLTEDYEIGVYIHNAGYAQLFAPLHKDLRGYAATREYFPRRVRSAIRQRTRWVTGIGLQSWARDGWRGSWMCKYWFWRDRKGLLTNPLSLLTNLLFVAGLADWLQASLQHRHWLFAVSNPAILRLCFVTSALQCVRLGMRMFSTGRIFGWKLAAGVPLRSFHGNFINCFASLGALWQYADARLHRRDVAWLKTDHAYPVNGKLAHGRGLADVLVTGGFLSQESVEEIQRELRSDGFLERLLLARGMVSEEEMCKAISLQSGVACSHIDTHLVKPRVMRTLPAHVQRQFGVIPFDVNSGKLCLAGSRVPASELFDGLKRYTQLPIEFHLVTERNYQDLCALMRAVGPSGGPRTMRREAAGEPTLSRSDRPGS